MSKCEQKLKKMEHERDHWRTQYSQLRHEFESLTREKERQQWYVSDFLSGGMQKLDARIEKLQEERDALLEEVRNIRGFMSPHLNEANTIPEDAPLRTKAQDGVWSKTLVFATLYFRDTDDPQYRILHLHGMYHGDKETARVELGSRIWTLLLGGPDPDNLPKTPKGFENVPDEILINAVLRIMWCETPEDANSNRLNSFENHIWPILDKEYSLTHTEALNAFTKYLDRAFEYMERRRMFYLRGGIRLFDSYGLLGVESDTAD